MSESVKIGGIGKNPAIDKINQMNAIDVKNYAAKRMEELILDKSAVFPPVEASNKIADEELPHFPVELLD